MGFTTGFTGGVTLTLSIAYLTVLAHQRNRQAQADSLRAQARVLDTLSSATPDRFSQSLGPRPTRAERAAAARANFVDRAKDRWNSEIEAAARWAQGQDMALLREGIEAAVGRAWESTFGSPGVGAAGDAPPSSSSVAAAVRETGVKGAEAVGDKTREITSAAGESAKGPVTTAVEKGKDIVENAKTVVGLAEESVQPVGAAVAEAEGLSDVEKALRQRYERRGDVMERSLTEVLNERYTPISRKDNTVLRGV